MNYKDLSELVEDERIKILGEHLMQTDRPVMITTDDVPGKLERYIEKLTARFPLVEVFEQGTGPVAGVVYFKARKKGH